MPSTPLPRNAPLGGTLPRRARKPAHTAAIILNYVLRGDPADHGHALLMGALAERLDMSEIQYERFHGALAGYGTGATRSIVGGFLRARGELYLLLVLLHGALATAEVARRHVGLKVPPVVQRMMEPIRRMRGHFEHIEERAGGHVPKGRMMPRDMYGNFGWIENGEVRFGTDVLRLADFPPLLDALHGMVRAWLASRKSGESGPRRRIVGT